MWLMSTFQTDLSGRRGNAVREHFRPTRPVCPSGPRSPTGFSTILAGGTDRSFGDDSSAGTADPLRLSCRRGGPCLVISRPHKDGYAGYGYAGHGHAGSSRMGADHCPASFRDVDRDDGRHDGAVGGAYDSYLSHCEPAPPGRGPAIRAGDHLSCRIPRRLDRVFRGGHARRMGFAPGRASFHYDDSDQHGAEWRTAYRGRHFPMDTAQARVPEGVPVAALLSDERMARGRRRRLHHGFAAWRVLRRLLLVPDGPALCRRGDESFMGRGDRALCDGRED